MKKNFRAAKNYSNRLADEKTPPTFYSCMEDIENVDAGASLTTPAKASALRKNGFVMLHGNPCKIVDLSTSSPGKHGHAKVHIIGRDVVSGKKYEDISPSTHTVNIPVMTRKEYLVVDMGTTGYLSLMDDNGFTRADLQVTDDDLKKTIGDKLARLDDDDTIVTVMKILDKELIMSVKTGVK